MKVLFVCTGNTFRSMSAKYLFNKYLQEKGEKKLTAYSAGVYAEPDEPFPETINKLKDLGVNPENHQQIKLTYELANNADFMIVMTLRHQNFVYQNFGVFSYLFNDIAFGEKTNLHDDSEADFEESLEEFVNHTIKTINKGIPNIYKFMRPASIN